MDNEQQLTDAFLKQLKTGDQLNSFLAQLQKRGIEKILEGELAPRFVSSCASVRVLTNRNVAY